MKKIVFVVLLVGLTVTMSLSAQNQWWRISASEGGVAARNNQINLRTGDNFVYVMFRDDVPRAPYNRVSINFVTEADVNVTFYAANCPGQLWGGYQGGTRRPANYPAHATAVRSGPVLNDFSHLTFTWTDLSKEPFSKPDVNGMVLLVNASERTTFRMTDIRFEQ